MKIIKTLSKSIREYKNPSLLSPLFIAIEVLMECFIPLIIARFINTINNTSIAGSELMRTIIIYGLILIAMAVVSLLGGMFAAKFSAKAGAGFAKNLRKDMFHKIQDFSFSNIDNFSS